MPYTPIEINRIKLPSVPSVKLRALCGETKEYNPYAT